MLNKVISLTEKFVFTALIFMMLVIVLLSIVELGWLLARDIISPPVLILEIHELLEIFGMFLLVLIGIELLETIQIYSQNREFRAEVIILVAVIAVSRKIITLDLKEIAPLNLIGISTIMLSLVIGYYAVKKIGSSERSKKGP